MGAKTSLNLRRLDGTLLLVFRELMRQGRGTTVGERLGLSPSGVSHALARLREIFDDQLFLRRPHGLSPTRRALELAPFIDDIIALAEEALDSRKIYVPEESERTFRIGLADDLASLVAMPIVELVARLAPHASIQLLQVGRDEARKQVREGELDLAIGCFESSDQFRVQELWNDELVLVLRSGHPLIAAPSGGAGRDLCYVDVRNAAIESSPACGARRVVSTVPDYFTAFSLVQDSDMATLAPQRIAARFSGALGVSIVKLAGSVPPIRTSMLRLPDQGADPAVEWLAETIGGLQIEPHGARRDGADAVRVAAAPPRPNMIASRIPSGAAAFSPLQDLV